MKKTVVVSLIAALMLLGYSVAQADSFDATVPLSFSVAEQFGFTLDKYSHDFGPIATGAGAETTFGIFCASNHGVVWNLSIIADQFSNGTDTFPSGEPGTWVAGDPGFSMAVWGNAAGDPDELQGTILYSGDPVPYATAFDFYQSSLGEGGDPFTPVTLGLYITLPSALASGLYATDMIITMYE